MIWKTSLVTLLTAMAVVIATGIAVIYSGVINVGAVTPHFDVTRWVLETTLEHSVQRHAKAISPPSVVRVSKDTVHHYSEMCGVCHGTPGREPSEVGKGLRPRPPDLVKAAPELKENEIFWIVKNGIRMTGMPAFGVTHSDQELWEVVFLVKRLPQMSPEEFHQKGKH